MVCPKIVRGDDPRLNTVRYNPLVSALPFKDEKRVSFEKENQFDEEEEYSEVNREEQAASYEGLRIGTRAHVPYNLQGYNKNAMLLLDASFFNAQSDMLAKRADVAATFAKFRFEIEQHVDLNYNEMNEKCREFLQRDFSDYGCVAVFIVTLIGLGFNDSNIVHYWKTDGNPTLRHKPKIYIRECGWPSNRGDIYTVPITEDHPNVLCLHVPAWPHDRTIGPLQILCKKLEDMADFDDMMTIIKESIRDTKPMYRARIFVASTLERRLFLSRTQHEVTRL